MIQPLVTVLLCTVGRRGLLPMAIRSYLSQSWENKELVVITSSPVRDLLEEIPALNYIEFDGCPGCVSCSGFSRVGPEYDANLRVTA